jgi:ATP-dependent Clp protease ATP-binding subunit ClpB
VFNVLLQLLDDGRLTDSHGRTVNFQHTIVIMTSNIGSEYLLDGIDAEGHVDAAARTQVLAALKQHFRPEFLNRVDDTVVFSPLTRSVIADVVKLFLNELTQRLAEQQVILDMTDAAVDWLAREGYDPVYGARPLKRFIQGHLETPVARLLIAGSVQGGGTIVVDMENDALVIRTGDAGG